MDLRTYMTAEGLTLTALARKLGHPVNTVHGWVNGNRIPSLRTAAAIEAATGGKVTASALAKRASEGAAA